MDRRRLLQTAAGVGVTALAGCGGTDPRDEQTPSSTDTTATPATPAMTDSEFTIVQTGGGQEQDEATVSVEGTTVTVEGTIWGANGCTTAELADASYDAASDELTVAVATTQEETTATEEPMCTMSLVEIEYRVTVTFENSAPGTVVVTHDHGDGPETVTTTST